MTGNAPDAPTKALAQRYFMRNYYRSGVEQSSRHMNRFCEMLDETGKLAVGLKMAKENDVSEYRIMRVEHKAKLRIRKRLNKLSKRMQGFNKRIRAITADPKMDGDVKFIKIQKLQKQKNLLAKEATEKYWDLFN